MASAASTDTLLMRGGEQIGARLFGEIGEDLERAHARGELAETGGQVAAAGADFQRDVAFGDLERLQDAPVHFRRQHRLTVRERNRGVGERDVAVTQRRKLLPLHLQHRLQDAFVEHVPGSDLLLDHLLARGLEIHRDDRRCGETRGRKGYEL